mmetsp:Transcript_26873/g.66538  ORF Transcript_26873/g.66538 Transcript_26873/m.66538 type:complete len:312 (+) Transcript_26873:699-1634(+)
MWPWAEGGGGGCLHAALAGGRGGGWTARRKSASSSEEEPSLSSKCTKCAPGTTRSGRLARGSLRQKPAECAACELLAAGGRREARPSSMSSTAPPRAAERKLSSEAEAPMGAAGRAAGGASEGGEAGSLLPLFLRLLHSSRRREGAAEAGRSGGGEEAGEAGGACTAHAGSHGSSRSCDEEGETPVRKESEVTAWSIISPTRSWLTRAISFMKARASTGCELSSGAKRLAGSRTRRQKVSVIATVDRWSAERVCVPPAAAAGRAASSWKVRNEATPRMAPGRCFEMRCARCIPPSRARSTSFSERKPEMST